ncbi:MAG: M50 family metallopeptidase, partial [Candidatus Thermoplasmatota archaeon]
HELAHKFMAQKYGLWSEYRMYPLGLLLALLLGLSFGLVFAAPGAVMFRGESRDFENGTIAVSGVSMNILISAAMLPLYFFVFYETFFESVIGFVCVINAFLGAFNLLPIYPLDGAKIVRWNFNVWFFLFAFAVGLAFYGLREIPLSFSI